MSQDRSEERIMSQSGGDEICASDLLWTSISPRGNDCEDTQPSPSYRALVAICYVTPYMPSVISRQIMYALAVLLFALAAITPLISE